jgi:K+-transporting ATPase ATPase C chain
MTDLLRPAATLLALLTLLTGIAYPLAMTGLAQAVLPHQANASLVTREGRVVGSALVGQAFVSAGYFHPRPSAVGHDAAAAGASNLGPTNAALIAETAARAADFRRINGVETVPIDALTASGSGLDPHISPANAAAQAARVAAARGVAPGAVRALVDEAVEAPWLGLFGAPHVNVLLLNLALDAAFGPLES